MSVVRLRRRVEQTGVLTCGGAPRNFTVMAGEQEKEREAGSVRTDSRVKPR